MEKPSVNNWKRSSDLDPQDAQPLELNVVKEGQESMSSGFVILTSKRPISHGKKNSQAVSEWFTGRLKRMKIKPITMSFDNPKAELPEVEVLSDSQDKHSTEASSGNEASPRSRRSSRKNREASDPNSNLMYDYGFGTNGEPIPVWKFLAKQQLRQQHILDLEEIDLNKNETTSEDDKDKSDISSKGDDNMKSFPAQAEQDRKQRRKKKSNKNDKNKKSSKNFQRNDKLKILEETFETKASSQEAVWVVIIDTPFRNLGEIESVEAMAEKYNFRILTLNPPFKSNILRMLGDIAQQKEQISQQKCLIELTMSAAGVINDFNRNYAADEELPIASPAVHCKRGFQESGVAVDSKKAYNYDNNPEYEEPKKRPVVIEIETDNENVDVIDNYFVSNPNTNPDPDEDEEADKAFQVTILHSQDTLKSSISSRSIRELETNYGRIGTVCEDESEMNNAVCNKDSFEEDKASGDSDDSSVFEMGEDNLFMCINQASKIVIPPPVSPRLFFPNLESRDSSNPRRALVVIIRDLQHDRINNFSLSRALKEKLKRNKIRAYVISISNMMKDLQAIQVMKDFANRIAMNDKKLGVTDGYSHLILTALAEKIANKSRRVVIIDLGDETSLRLWPVRDFCIRSHAEVMTLERLHDEPEGPFESKLSKLCKHIRKRYKTFDWNALQFYNEAVTGISNKDLSPFLPHPQLMDIMEAPGQPDDDLGPYRTSSEAEEQEVVQAPDFNSEFEEDERTVYDFENVREQLTRNSHTQMESMAVESNLNGQSESYHLSKASMKRHNSKGNLEPVITKDTLDLESNHRSLCALRRHVAPSESSERSVKLSELFVLRPKLLKIHRTPDGKVPSTLFSKLHEVSKQPSYTDEEYLYKGWVAVAQAPEKRLAGVQRFVRNTGVLVMRILRPVGSFLTCSYCRNHNETRVVPQPQVQHELQRQRRHRRGIIIESEDAFYSNN